MTLLCVPIFVESTEQAGRQIARAAEAGADTVELRIDSFHDADAIAAVLSHSPLPVILTCRPTAEGGRCVLPEPERIALLRGLSGPGVSFVDIEHSSNAAGTFVQRPRADRPGVIVSSHDFQSRPERLTSLFADLCDSPADVAKIAWAARSVRDNIEAFELLSLRRKPAIVLCMGDAGLPSRILARKFGAFLTFASPDDSSGTAAGQVPISQMKRLYRWDAIGETTKVYGVVGSPVAHSMSPAIHNAGFEQVGHDGVYLPLPVTPGYESFKAFMESWLGFAPLQLSGLSVTIPHKENALRYLKEKGADIEPLAERIGAVNTIAIIRDNAGTPVLVGRNTDYAAILDSITSAMGVGREALAGLRVAVIGAGGTGRTAVAALAHCGAQVVVYNRTRDRADALAAEFTGKTGVVIAASLDALPDAACRVYLNTTSVGMHPNVDQSIFANRPPRLPPGTVVFDTVYNPLQTRLLSQSAAAGATTIAGIEMFVRQAAGQFELWTGLHAPTALMRRIVESRLNGQ